MSDTGIEKDKVTKEVAAKEADKEDKWSKEKQRADQSEANYKKIANEKNEIISQLSERDNKITELERRMEELTDAKDVSVEELLDQIGRAHV